MNTLARLYRHRLALLTDLYELTMAYGYWKEGLAEREAVFHVAFRKPPFGGSYALACGLSSAIDFLDEFRFEDEDLAYLASLTGGRRRPLFEPAFLEYLGELRFVCDVDAAPEGTPVFAKEPLIRVQGPLLQSQILETALLTIVNFQTLIASKAARVREAAGDDLVLEFGLRRAQGIDGGVSASRAAYIGGCDGVSNVLAGKLFDIPVRGTHAHSWVMAFDSEQEAFAAYAHALPQNSILLVDTYNTLEGVRRAIEVGRQMRERGEELQGVRLDSGDLAALSIESRRMLDEAGFPNTKIIGSGDLDEYEIAKIKAAGARIDSWGVGTRLATAYEEPALGGVYKLSAVQDEHGRWKDRLKLSEQVVKMSDPGLLQVRRYYRDDRMVGDMIFDNRTGVADDSSMRHLATGEPMPIGEHTRSEDLLQPIFRRGRRVYNPPSAREARRRAQEQLQTLAPEVRRLSDPREYPVGMEPRLHEHKMQMIGQLQGEAP